MPESMLVGLEVDEVSNVDHPANGRTFLVLKRDGEMADNDTKTVDDLSATITEQEARIAELEAQVKATETEKSKDTEDLYKNLPDPVRKELEDGKAAREALAKATDEAEAKQYVEKAADFAPLGKADTVGPWLRTIAKAMDTETYTAFETALTAVTKQADHITDETGTVGEGEADEVVKITKIAKQLRADDPDLSQSAAMRQAMKQLSDELG